MKKFILIHYGEIGLKGANKGYFVKKLCSSIKEKLQKAFKKTFSVSCFLGRIMVPLGPKLNEEKISEILEKISGLKNYQFVYEGDLDLKKLGKQILKNWPKDWKKDDSKTFRVSVKRSQNMKVTSVEAERNLGAILLKNNIGMKAKMKNPDVTINVEFFKEHGYFSYKKSFGLGGMSSNTGGKLIAMISAGIDSPVAAYRMMRRGARVIFVHFDGYPYTDDVENEHVKDLVKILSEYQKDTKLYMVPFGEIQKKIATNLDVPAKYRTVLYRRFMIMISEKIARRQEAKGVITGDSFGQVASQTPENMFTIHEVSKIPLYQPLIGYDKEEIIRMAEKIGTYEISKLPCKDTCSMFMPKNPEIKAKIQDVKEYESKLPVQEWVTDAVKKSTVLFF